VGSHGVAIITQRITLTPFHRKSEKGTEKEACDRTDRIFEKSGGEVACSREQKKN
jgi:hypothetical protein